MAKRWIVTALGQDRPGIVASVTEVLYTLGCNLEDSAMTRLEGEFAIMLIFSTTSRDTEDTLHKAFEPLAKRLALAIHLKGLTKAETSTPRKRGTAYFISVYGADRPGIVFRIAEALAHAQANITDVHTHRSSRGGPSLYVLLLEVECPASRAIASIERQLKRIAKRLGVEVSVRPSDATVL